MTNPYDIFKHVRLDPDAGIFDPDEVTDYQAFLWRLITGQELEICRLCGEWRNAGYDGDHGDGVCYDPGDPGGLGD